MPRGLQIARDGYVRRITDVKIAWEGEVKTVQRKLVACGGIAREVWPATPGSGGNRLRLSSDGVTSRDIEESPTDAIAVFGFDVAMGQFYWRDLNTDYTEVAINPSTSSTGEILMRVDQVSGDPILGDSEGVWIDVHSGGLHNTFEWYIDWTDDFVGSNSAVVDFTMAPDYNGTGIPDLSNAVTKRVTLRAEVTGGDITMSTEPLELEDIRAGEPAWTTIQAWPQQDGQGGFICQLLGIEGPPGSVPVFVETISNNWTGNEEVKVDVVSGVGVTENPVGAWLPLQTSFKWNLIADDPNEDLVTVCNFSLRVGAETVTKQITMHSQRIDGTAGDDIVLDEGLEPIVTQLAVGQNGGANVQVRSDGTLDLFTDILNSGSFVIPLGFPVNWHADAPSPTDPGDYEAMIQMDNGTQPDIGPVDTWLNLSTTRLWKMLPPQTLGQSKQGYWRLRIRKVGQADTEHAITISVAVTHNTGIVP